MKGKSFLVLFMFIHFWVGKISYSQVTSPFQEKPAANFYDIQRDFYSNPAIQKIEKELSENINAKKKQGSSGLEEGELGPWLKFKRWEYFMEPRVYPTGKFFNPSIAWNNYNAFLKTSAASHKKEQDDLFEGNWTSLNPVSIDGDNGIGAGRINCVRFDPNNSNIIYAGVGTGGVWKSTDGGTSWLSLTDHLGSLGISDIAIDPANSNIIYIATGDTEGASINSDVSASYSIGVMKSTDGGITWDTTGLNWTTSQTALVNRLLIHPTNTNIIFGATSNGIYVSTDGGANWSVIPDVSSGNFRDMEFKPSDPSVIYAVSSNRFYKSSNSGANFSNITSGLPSPNVVSRWSIAVTPADPNYVYIIGTNANTTAFQGLYRSTNSGTSFSLRSNSPSIFCGDSDGNDDGNNSGNYQLPLAVSPLNKDEVIAGGINAWYSSNGGTTWTLASDWTVFYPNSSGSGANYMHGDIHDLVYLPGSGSVILSATDGGLYRAETVFSQWKFKSNGMDIAQIYRIGNSTLNKNIIVQGLQDNQTMLNKANEFYKIVFYGDGMDCFIDWSDDNYIYGSQYSGAIRRSSDGGDTYVDIPPAGAGLGAWVTPWMMDPTNSQTLYAGYTNMYKSTNRGDDWTKMGATIGGAGKIVAFDVAPSNTSIAYVTKRNGGYSGSTTIYKTLNSGAEWINIGSGLPLGAANKAAITAIEVHNTDPDKLWVTFSGYNDTIKVFMSSDGGTTWKNMAKHDSAYANKLPNLPFNTVVYQKGTDIVYVGGDIGIYYTQDDGANWYPFSQGIPNVIVSELEIHYGANKLRAATYGRGIWESDLYDVAGPVKTPVEKLTVLPNPNPGQFTVEFSSSEAKNYTIEIRNIAGQLIHSEEINDFSGNYSSPYDLSDLAKGMYFLTLFDTEKKSVSKSIIY